MTRADVLRLSLVIAATVATVAALFALDLNAADGSRMVTALLSFLAALAVGRPDAPLGAGVALEVPASSSSSPAAPAAPGQNTTQRIALAANELGGRGVVALGVYTLADAVAAMVVG